MQNTKIKCALVSTNSICQGETVTKATNINGYLINADNVFIESRNTALCNVPPMVYGNKPTDGGFLFLTEQEREDVLKKEPQTEKYIKQILGSEEFINNKKRYCLWLVGANPAEIKKSKFLLERVEAVRKFRLSSTKAATQKDAATPTLFQEIRQPTKGNYLLVPRVSSEKRTYVPIGFMSADVIASDACQIIPNATLYHFGILTSSVHMAWMRAVCGKLKSDYRYSKDIVYNNFVWCNPSDAQKAKIEACAQAILDARAKYPDCSLADLYNETLMPIELRKTHTANDNAVKEAYGFNKNITESEIVAELFKLYENSVKKILENKMKKFFIVFAILSLFLLISCGNDSKNEENSGSNNNLTDEESGDSNDNAADSESEVFDDSDSTEPEPTTDDDDTSPEQNGDDTDIYDTDDDNPMPDNDLQSVINLSESEPANCYIVKTAGNYSFNATVPGNGKKAEGIDFTNKTLNPVDVKLLWQSDKNGLIDSLEIKEGKITFTANGRDGNALIAALDEAENTLWSWHIWFLNEELAEIETLKGDKIMDRNLGATSLDPESPKSHGVLYQWGRKDPFPASPIVSGGTTSTMPLPLYDEDGNEVEITHSSWENSENNTLEYAIAHPTTVLSNYSYYSECRDWLRNEFSNSALWGGSNGEKTLFDPCPVGYRVPKLGTFDFFTSSGGYETDMTEFSIFDITFDGIIDENDYRNGWYILLDSESDSYSYFPAATRYDGSYAMLMGSKTGLWGNYWYADADDSKESFIPCGAFALAFQLENADKVSASPAAIGGRADGYSVRCVKE